MESSAPNKSDEIVYKIDFKTKTLGCLVSLMLFFGAIIGFMSITNRPEELTGRYSGVIKIFASLNEKGAPWGAIIILLLFLIISIPSILKLMDKTAIYYNYDYVWVRHKFKYKKISWKSISSCGFHNKVIRSRGFKVGKISELFLSFEHEDGSSDRRILKPVDIESLDVKYFLNIAASKNKFVDHRAD